MHDLKLRDTWWHYKAPTDVDGLRSDCLKQIAENFNISMRRVHRFFTTIPWMFGRSQLQIRALMVAKHRFGAREIFDSDLHNTILGEKVLPFAKHIIEAFNTDHDGKLDERTSQLYEAGGDQFIAGAESTEEPNEAREFAESLLIMMLMNAWSTFEIMACDLWVAAVNKGDHKFATNICSKGKETKSFTFEELKDYLDQQLGTVIGQVLMESERVKMDSFKQIIENYQTTFQDRELSEVFAMHKSAPSNVLALESVRNQLMHRGHVIDDKFVKQLHKAEGCSIPKLKELREDDKFLVDGEMVKTLIESAIQLGADMIRIVDKLVTPNENVVLDQMIQAEPSTSNGT